MSSYGEGRICAEPGCSTSLSRYNKDELCWRHTEARDTSQFRRP